MTTLALVKIQQRMVELKDWNFEGNSISKELSFLSFRESVDFINKIAELAEKVNHHPDILISYNNVRLVLTTHTEKGLTDIDFEMAKMIDSLG
ncbi:MAG: 4a-hydroxytetrahydrobiopterin dehydratase [Nanoarchaeota archaeon]